MGSLRPLSGPMWAVLGCLGAPVGGLLGVDQGRNVAQTRAGERFLCCLGATVGGLVKGSGASGGGLGQLSGPLRAVWGRSRGLCGRSWAVLGPLWAVLGGDRAEKWPRPEWEGHSGRQAPLAGLAGLALLDRIALWAQSANFL